MLVGTEPPVDPAASLPAYPDQAELLRVSRQELGHWLDRRFLRPDPYAFRDSDFRQVVHLVSGLLDVDPNGIFCLGSGAIGLSLNPDKVIDGSTLKPYDDESDLDLAVISSHYFDVAWRDLRKAFQPTIRTSAPEYRELFSWQRNRLFDGAVIADKVLPMLSFGSEWLKKHEQMSESISILLGRNVDVHFWIYRDYWGVRNHVSEGVLACQKALL